jgi:hypothetical protein
MNRFQELDTLLSSDEKRYDYEDWSLYAEELIAELSGEDTPSLLEAWNSRDELWCSRFSEACMTINPAVLSQLLEAAICTSQKVLATLGLMTRLPKQADQSFFYQLLLEYIEKQWYEQPQLHRQIQMCAWSCGLSGRLLKRLCFKSWTEAGL